ncbi:FAD binding domain-containing protein [Nocardiopsis sp. N85]|uniref:FAD binding domain-containing protein n=1 Tax=Nocardiopsis sp. N85 TaxID=3029400 RepID=UPI00237F6A23|nr:FAD binding domain-containing protein [Nocardiopsis sp. N85]MDE3722257.1 FAD binding domain-containing protein [Nocardiopsis sp. N85]
MSTIVRPDSLGGALAALAEGARPRAGGVEQAAPGAVVDLTGVADLRGIGPNADGTVRIGAMTTVAALAGLDSHPALALTAGALGTPQIRGTATVGGNLLQRTRCAYLRSPVFSCARSGGMGCPSREGDHLHGVVFDSGVCAAPHPSSLAVALLAHDARVEVVGPSGARTLPIADLYDAVDPVRDHRLSPDEILVAVTLPAGIPGDRVAHRRAAGRSRAEWPLVEAVVRLSPNPDGTVERAAVAVGAVARVPLRLPEVETALVGAVPGAPPGPEVDAALAEVVARCSPLPGSRYKVELVRATLTDVIGRALSP